MSKKSNDIDDPKNRREHTRYKPEDADCIVAIDSNPASTEDDFVPTDFALIFSESFGGLGLVLRNSDDYENGKNIFIRFNELHPFQAEIVWVQKVDPEVMKIGVKFLK